MAQAQFLVRIGYRSGQVEEFWFNSFKLSKVDGEATVAGIECQFADPAQTNFMFGLENIAYAYQVAVRMVEEEVAQ